MDAGFRSLETGHLEDLSLRALAKEVGVTPTAAYNHFADKMALMVEMKTEGFRRFDASLTEALEPANDASPEDKVRCLGRAYMAFAFKHPGIFNLIFFWTPEQKYLTDALSHAAACGENKLKGIVAEMLQADGTELNDYQKSVASFSAWSMVHGITLLLKTGVVDAVTYCENWPQEFSSQNPESQAHILEHLLEIQIEGLKRVLPGVKP